MRPSSWLTLAMTLAGTASLRLLGRRHEAEKNHKQVSICLDLDDCQAIAVRAGLPLEALLPRMAQRGATHVSLPEWTLERLLNLGRLTPQAPSQLRSDPPPVGHWNYLAGDPNLVKRLADELSQRLPQTAATIIGKQTLVFGGDLPTLGEIGLGFDTLQASLIQSCGLEVVPRPVSYAWPLPDLVRRTLAQAAPIGRQVAFAGEMILGHEMHLDATVEALQQHDLTFVYFAESRHQKGDWFIAKRRAPRLVLGHRFTPQEMVPLDYHAACHNWVHLVRERGIRFCYVNFFKVLHATAPLEGLDYIDHLRQALLQAGFEVSPEPARPRMPAPDAAALALAGLTTAGIAASAVNEWLDLPDRWALPLSAAAVGSAVSLPFLEKARNLAAAGRQVKGGDHHHHHHGQPQESASPGHDDHDASHRPFQRIGHGHDHDAGHDHGELRVVYPPSYAPKLLSLGLTALTPVAILASLERHGPAGWWQGVIQQAAASGTLAVLTSGREYQLRIEEYRGFNLDWLLPLAAVGWRSPVPAVRFGSLALLSGSWLLARQRNLDLLARLDPGHAEGHTHHISAAMALIGDMGKAVGPRPARKWSGLGPAAFGASQLFSRRGQQVMALAASGLGVVGSILGLASFRRPERALAETLQTAGPSLAAGSGLGMLLLLAAWLAGDDD